MYIKKLTIVSVQLNEFSPNKHSHVANIQIKKQKHYQHVKAPFISPSNHYLPPKVIPSPSWLLISCISFSYFWIFSKSSRMYPFGSFSSTWCLRFIHALCNFSLYIFIPCTNNNLLTHSTANRYLSCFHLGAKINSAVTVFGYIYTLFFFLARLIFRSGIAKLNFCSYFQMVFQNDCTNLYFCQQCMLYILTNFI